ncbi:S24 family peptidase, partial [Aeromonas caviae]
WFVVKDDRFCTDFALNETQIDQLHHMMQELLDLRMAQYLARKSRIRSAQSTASSDTGERAEVVALGSLRQTAPLKPENSAVESGSLLSYFPNLKIACGHFKHGDESDMALQRLDSSWGELDPKRHFLARASGNSMDGGKQPIVDGDLLLLEWITPDSAGSITGSIMAIEQEDESGLNQYLLRVVTKNSAGQYRLKANNRDYPELSAHENMRTFARLKNVIKIDESRAK